MNELTLSEAIKRLSQNEGLEFKWINCEKYSKEPLYIGYNSNVLCYYNKADQQQLYPLGFNNDIVQNARFVEVKQPVSFGVAIVAFNNNNRDIYCIYKNERFDYERKPYKGLKDKDNNPITSYEILYGQWYIGEESSNDNE